jgi:hypothetical protein
VWLFCAGAPMKWRERFSRSTFCISAQKWAATHGCLRMALEGAKYSNMSSKTTTANHIDCLVTTSKVL